MQKNLKEMKNPHRKKLFIVFGRFGNHHERNKRVQTKPELSKRSKLNHVRTQGPLKCKNNIAITIFVEINDNLV